MSPSMSWLALGLGFLLLCLLVFRPWPGEGEGSAEEVTERAGVGIERTTRQATVKPKSKTAGPRSATSSVSSPGGTKEER